ncbi:MAG: TRAP transporter small permease [Clostridiaceae bacterium]|nr:TRAP transporter small permease [Clostridiaceae bacterium]
MNKFEKIVTKTSRLLDDIAGWVIVATMALVVVNIILRAVFKNPVKGVYEYTGYLTALVIGFAIAQCAIEKAHIAVDFFIEKLNLKVQLIIDTVLSGLIILFLAFSSIQVFLYGINVISSGEVSATAHLPFYPFIFMVSAGLFILCLVEINKVIKGVANK